MSDNNPLLPAAYRRRLPALYVALLACGVAMSRPANAQRLPVVSKSAHAVIPDEILIGLRPDADTGKIERVIKSLGVIVHSSPRHNDYRVKTPHGTDMEATMRRLRAMSGVAYAAPNRIVHITDGSLPNDPFLGAGSGPQWGVLRTDAYLAWNICKPKNAQPIIIAIVDTGVDSNHPDLTNVILRDAIGGVIGYDAINRVPDPALPVHPHGTHLAGIAAAQTNNGIGISGMAGWTGDPNASDTAHIKIMPVRVLNAQGDGSDDDLAAGIDWAVAHGAKIINLSLGDTMPTPKTQQAVEDAWNAGSLVCAAAGNEGNTNYFYPAYSPHVISAAATSYNYVDSIPYWSTTGGWVTVSAPGENIYSTFPNNSYEYQSGTSMASPHVAGLAAMIWAQNPTLTNADVTNFIIRTVDKYPANADPIAPGSGRINANTAIKAVNSAMTTLAGTVELQGSVNAAQAVTVRFRSTDGKMDFAYPVTLNSIASGSSVGSFTLSGIPAASYNVAVQGSKWLRKTTPLTLSAAGNNTLSVTLLGGDANGDNRVDIGDFGMLINAYGGLQSDPNSGYAARADFNCDGSIDVADFGLLVNNFSAVGDM